MGDVIELPKEVEDLVWICSCGCSSHYIHINGDCECANCGSIASAEGFYVNLPEGTEKAFEDLDEEPFRVLHGDDLHFSLQRLGEQVSRNEFAVVIAIRTDGRCNTHGKASDWTPEQKRWLRGRIRKAYKMVTGDAD